MNILDERPKATLQQKKEIAQAGIFSTILLFNKNLSEEVDALVWENEQWAEKRLKVNEL